MLIHAATHLLFVCVSHSHPECRWSSFFAACTETPGGTLNVSTVLAGGAVLTPWSSLWGLSKVYFSSAPLPPQDVWTVSSLLEVVCFNTAQGPT